MVLLALVFLSINAHVPEPLTAPSSYGIYALSSNDGTYCHLFSYIKLLLKGPVRMRIFSYIFNLYNKTQYFFKS